MGLSFSNKFFLTFLLSCILHIIIFIFFLDKKKVVEINRYKIMNLASFKKYETPKLKQENIKQKKIENKKEKTTNQVKKPIIKKKENEKSISIKRPEEKKINEIKKLETKEIKKNLNNSQKELMEPKKKMVTKKNQLTSRNTLSENDKKIQNKELEKYFLLIVEEMTILAKKSYPRRSRMLEEEGKIFIEIKINSNGTILNTKLKTKKPKRLANAAEGLLKRKKQFPNPPSYLFEKKQFFTFEIPINFILK